MAMWYDPHTMTDNFESGFQAYLDGQELESNPFPEGSDEYFDWEAGWVAASDQDNED